MESSCANMLEPLQPKGKRLLRAFRYWMFLLWLWPFPNLAQIDTLSYFQPTRVETLGVAFTGVVDGAAVYFTPRQEHRYDLLELHFLVVPVLKLPPNAFLRFWLHASNPDTLPGDTLAALKVPLSSPTDLFPNWKKVSLTDSVWSRSLTGPFWLSGQLTSLVVSLDSLGHSFYHVISPVSRWERAPLEFAVRAIVRYTGPVSIAAPQTRRPSTFPALKIQSTTEGDVRLTVILTHPQQARLSVYNMLGQKIITLHHGMMPAGRSEFFWDGRSATRIPVARGIYFAILETQSGRQVRPVPFLR